MIYLDTSVVLAQLLAEDRLPPPALWQQTVVSSRLLEYELWNRLNARKLHASHAELARDLLQRLAFIEMAPPVLARALEPFPLPVRTLDVLHLSSIEFLRAQQQPVELASYDARMLTVARRLRIPIYSL